MRENCNSSPANIYHDITIKVQSSKQRLVFLGHSLILVLRMPFPPSSCLRKNVLNNGREPSNSISEYYSSFVEARLLSYCCQRWFNFLTPLISSRFLALRSTSGLETALSVSKFFQIFLSLHGRFISTEQTNNIVIINSQCAFFANMNCTTVYNSRSMSTHL